MINVQKVALILNITHEIHSKNDPVLVQLCCATTLSLTESSMAFLSQPDFFSLD